LVDPLDGTKEFINKNGEFTVNIAYIEDKKAVRGVIFAPAINRLFYTLENGKSVEEHFPLSPSEYGKITKLKTKYNGESLIVVGSKSHFDSNTENYISSYNVLDFKSAGSSLKICLLATGEADFYPRLSPTMEWDIAAGHAILKGSGGNIYDSSLSEMKYSKDNFRNNKFVASLSGIKIDSF
jgi:3'(2'), 5'-bisphosphate nucleotidase